MSAKKQRYFYLTDDEYSFIQNFKNENGLQNLSETLSYLIADYKKLIGQQKEYQKTIKISRSAARDAHLCLLLLSVNSRDWEHQIFIPKDSELLKDARAFYSNELKAARTRKSNEFESNSGTDKNF